MPPFTIRSVVALSDRTVVMADAAVGPLADGYGISRQVVVIPYGMPAIEPHGRVQMKEKLGVSGRTLIFTFGLVDPRKGLEYMIEAMPAVRAEHPTVSGFKTTIGRMDDLASAASESPTAAPKKRRAHSSANLREPAKMIGNSG